MIAGGALLFVIAMGDLFSASKSARQLDPETVGAVPLGVPLMVGPAVLATMILLANDFGKTVVVGAVMANLILAGVAFRFSQGLHRLLGETGMRIISKVISIILAAFGVMMVRKGIMAILTEFHRTVS